MLHGARGRGPPPVQRAGAPSPPRRRGPPPPAGRPRRLMQHRRPHVARREGSGHAAGTAGRRAVPVVPVDVRTHVTDVSTADVSTPGASTPDVSAALGTDFVGIAAEFGDEERDYLQRTRAFVDDEVLPVIYGLLGAGGVPVRGGAPDGCARPGQRRHRLPGRAEHDRGQRRAGGHGAVAGGRRPGGLPRGARRCRGPGPGWWPWSCRGATAAWRPSPVSRRG